MPLHSIGGSPTPGHPRRQVHKAQICRCRSIIHIDLTLTQLSQFYLGQPGLQAAEVVLNLVPEWKFHRPVQPAQRVLSTVAPLQLAPICRPPVQVAAAGPAPHTALNSEDVAFGRLLTRVKIGCPGEPIPWVADNRSLSVRTRS